MSTTEIIGGLGKLYQPSPRLRSMYAYGIRKPGGEGANSPWLVVTNGDLVLKDAQAARYTAHIASAVVPVICIPREMTDKGTVSPLQFRKLIQSFLGPPDGKSNDESPNIYKILRFKSGATGLERGNRLKAADILIKTWPQYEGHGFLAFDTNEHTHLMSEEYEMHEILDRIQAWISEIMITTKPPQMDWAPLGYGLIDMGEQPSVDKAHKPGWRTRYLQKYELDMTFPTKSAQQRDMAFYNFYLELLAQQLAKMIAIKGYTDEDYMALAWQILYQRAGVGANTRPTEWPYTADDIFGQVLDRIGEDSNEAFTFRWGSWEEVQEYLILCILKGVVQSRIKAETKPVDFHLVSGDRITAVNALQRIWHADYDVFGSEGQPFWVPSRTYPGRQFPMPMMLREGVMNSWDRIAPIMGDSFTKVNVEHGEITQSVLEPLDIKQMYIEFITAANDSRRWEIMYRRAKAIIWRFRLHGFADAVISDKGRAVQYLMTQLIGCVTHYKRGYLVVPQFAVIDDPGFVNIFQGTTGVSGPAVTKSDTAAVGNQVLAPGASSVTAKEEKTNVEQIVPQPSTQPSPPPMQEIKAIPGAVASPKQGDTHLKTAEETPKE